MHEKSSSSSMAFASSEAIRAPCSMNSCIPYDGMKGTRSRLQVRNQTSFNRASVDDLMRGKLILYTRSEISDQISDVEVMMESRESREVERVKRIWTVFV